MSASQKLAGFAVAIVLFGFATAPAAQAASLSSTQVEAILSLLQSFGADQSVINNVSVALGGSPATNQTCVDLSSNLTLGSTGSDVTNLQNYLTNKSYFSGAATGYYGYGTAGAVGQLLDRVDEAEARILHQETDRRAVRAAAEAVVELLGRADREGGRFFVVERAAGGEVGAGFFERDVAVDQIDDVYAVQQFLNE